jgi:hypothetical protein
MRRSSDLQKFFSSRIATFSKLSFFFFGRIIVKKGEAIEGETLEAHIIPSIK